MKKNLTYESSGVNIEKGNEAVDQIKNSVKNTYNENVLGDLGSFGGLFQLDNNLKNPVLVSGTDGVGTKLKVAFLANKHDTIGIDLVAMCVNDILCQGAKPLFFLDYVATGEIEPKNIKSIVKGISEGCKQSKIPLLGGETAEMPGFYKKSEYDLAGFAVGICEKDKLITGQRIKNGDVLVGFKSSGIHSNGYSLVRKLFFDILDKDIDEYIDDLGLKVKDELLKPTKIYLDEFNKMNNLSDIKGCIHITGGGFIENIPRVLPKGLSVNIDCNSWERPKIFNYIQNKGKVKKSEMFKTFNMGIGMVFVISKKDLNKVKSNIKDINIIGEVVKGDFGVKLCQ
ncbi:MAG: phosphoribosylformylglycinamidine cyclo-ligase [Bacillota bacterium]